MHFCVLRWCIKLFTILGIVPEKKTSVAQVIIYFFILSGCITKIIMIILLLVCNEKSGRIKDFVEAFASIAMFANGMIKAATFFINKSDIFILLDKTSCFWSNREHSPSCTMQKSSTTNTLYVKKVFYIYTIMSSIAIVFFLVQMIIVGGNASFPSYTPAWISQKIIYIYEGLVVSLGLIFPTVISDLFFMTLVMLIGNEFQLLNDELLEIFDKDMRTDNELKTDLAKCIRHHRFLIKYVDHLNTTFSTLVLTYIGIIVLLICTHMYTLSVENCVSDLAEVIIRVVLGLFELNICYSLPAQTVLDQANKISTSCYMNKWYENPQFARDILMIMSSHKIKTFIKIGGFDRLNLETCLRTMKTMMSYFMFLRTVGTKEL